MFVLNAISGLFSGFTPLSFIRMRLARFGAFISWLGQCLTARNTAVHESQARMERFALVKRVAEQNSGAMRAEEKQTLADFFNDITGPEGTTEAGHAQFVLDAIRTACGKNRITVEGRKFFSKDPRFQRAYADYLQKNGLSNTEKEVTDFFADYFLKKSGEKCENSPKWLGLIEGIIFQSFNLYATRLGELAAVFAELGMAVGTTIGVPTFPREITIDFQRDESGAIIGLSLDFKIGYRVNDSNHGPLAHIEIASSMYIDFDEEDKVRVAKGDIHMRAVATNELSLKEIAHAKTYYPSTSLAESIAQWTFWGVNALSQGALEMHSISHHLEQMEAYIRRRGEGGDAVRERLEQMRKLYQETGHECFKKAEHAKVRALFEEEAIDLDFRDVEERLSQSFERQFAERTEDGDLRMYVGDNSTRSIMKTDIIFQPAGRHPRAEYNSESPFYAGGKAGEERRYFKALQRELHGRYPSESPVRDMVQVLMTQAVTLDFTADLFEKTVRDGYGLPGDIPGACESSIVVRSDERITYTLKTRYNLVSTDNQVAGQIEVDAAVDLRYEDGPEGKAWVPRIVKRDISVIHDM